MSLLSLTYLYCKCYVVEDVFLNCDVLTVIVLPLFVIFVENPCDKQWHICCLCFIYFYIRLYLKNVIVFKAAFAVVHRDKICGRSVSSDHSGYCVINRMINKHPRWYEQHIYETVCHM